MELLAREQYQIEKYSETHFEGTLTTSKDSTAILTTLPYDEGWRIKVDGKHVPIEKTLDALVSFRIEGEGAHKVEMTYSPRAVNIGLFVSLGSLAVYGVRLAYEPLIRRKRKNITN